MGIWICRLQDMSECSSTLKDWSFPVKVHRRNAKYWTRSLATTLSSVTTSRVRVRILHSNSTHRFRSWTITRLHLALCLLTNVSGDWIQQSKNSVKMVGSFYWTVTNTDADISVIHAWKNIWHLTKSSHTTGSWLLRREWTLHRPQMRSDSLLSH